MPTLAQPAGAGKHFSLFVILGGNRDLVQRTQVGHVPGAFGAFLSQFPEGTPVALATVGHWYWIVDEIEEAGCIPLLAHAAKAKVTMGNVHKTNKLDTQGQATLLDLGKLPPVRIPSAEVRDERELPRTRMTFAGHRSMRKTRIHSALAKYALSLDTASDISAPKWRPELKATPQQLPDETGRCALRQRQILDAFTDHIKQLEDRILDCIQTTPTTQLVQTVPGPAKVLAILIEHEVASIDRISAAKHFTGYCGFVPKLSASIGRAHYGRMAKQVNTYLKWAFIEAANFIIAHRDHPNWRRKYVEHLYESTRRRKGHSVAVGATARYLAWSTYWVLKESEPYRDPPHWAAAGKRPPVSLTQEQARAQYGS